MKKVALCIIATKSYKRLLEPLLESVKKYFLTQHELSLFIFADSADCKGWLDPNEYNVCWTQIEHLPFPLPTLFRYKYILKKENELSNFDYIFYCDADARFVGEVGDEALGEGITAIQHPAASSNTPTETWGNFMSKYGKKRTTNTGDVSHKQPEIFWDLEEEFKKSCFEPNLKSLAYIPPEKQTKYWCGAIQGGSSEKYLEVIKILDRNIDEDLGQNIVAVYHDETHWNRYLLQNPPDITLPFWYCFPESKDRENRQNLWKEDVYVPKGKEIKMLCLNKDLHGGYHLYRGNAKK
tara:strand:+ start:1899 stop:2783 length:885 start_codon:yes stop_codon:yes gene_type:complete